MVVEYKVYKRRWVVLLLFAGASCLNGMHWTQFAIISNVIQKYYGVGMEFVDWTSMIYMILYVPFIVPSSWYLNKVGLRITALTGMFGTSLGAWIKMFAADPHLFPLAFVGQSISSASMSCLLSLPSRIAAVWFSLDQVSTACSIGVIGNQLGVGLGFVLPPLLVPYSEDMDKIAENLQNMYYSYGVAHTLLLILMFFFFENKPPTPPSAAEDLAEDEPFVQSLKDLMLNLNFMLLFIAYGINGAVYFAISTLMNPLVLQYFPGCEKDVGWIGLSMVVTGMFGSLAAGWILDKTRKYKETNLAFYALTTVCMWIVTFTMDAPHIAVIYATISALGLFMTGYLPVGFEYAAELTYPISEFTSSGLLNASTMGVGFLCTMLYTKLFYWFDDIVANLFLSIILVIGTVISTQISADLRRMTVNTLATRQAN